MALGLTTEQRHRYRRDGFLVLPGFADAPTCDALRRRAYDLIDAFDPDAGKSVFTTDEQERNTDAYFLDSGHRVRFFFESEAMDSNGALTQPKRQAINKIGHALHDLDPEFDRFSRQARLEAIAGDVGMRQPLLLQSMIIVKPPRIGGEVTCHQDATFLATEPPSAMGLWVAVEDATIENGCMYAIPGGHLQGLKRRFRRLADDRVVFDELDSAPFVGDPVPLEAPKGTLILLHGMLPHFSAANRSAVSRMAYTLHLVDGSCRYLPDNWLRRPPEMPPRGFR
jgi:phytanoyl-CoA hydroxylase